MIVTKVCNEQRKSQSNSKKTTPPGFFWTTKWNVAEKYSLFRTAFTRNEDYDNYSQARLMQNVFCIH
jgi:hypothetical protein